ncbi:MAG: MoaD/ThiS family protein [Microbacteriaceae bacterium]
MAEPAARLLVRYFAGAAEAAGCRAETLEPVATIGELKAVLLRRHGARMARVVASASFLVDGVLSRDDARPLGSSGAGSSGAGSSAAGYSGAGPAVRVDVLPPFAGG